MQIFRRRRETTREGSSERYRMHIMQKVERRWLGKKLSHVIASWIMTRTKVGRVVAVRRSWSGSSGFSMTTTRDFLSCSARLSTGLVQACTCPRRDNIERNEVTGERDGLGRGDGGVRRVIDRGNMQRGNCPWDFLAIPIGHDGIIDGDKKSFHAYMQSSFKNNHNQSHKPNDVPGVGGASWVMRNKYGHNTAGSSPRANVFRAWLSIWYKSHSALQAGSSACDLQYVWQRLVSILEPKIAELIGYCLYKWVQVMVRTRPELCARRWSMTAVQNRSSSAILRAQRVTSSGGSSLIWCKLNLNNFLQPKKKK